MIRCSIHSRSGPDNIRDSAIFRSYAVNGSASVEIGNVEKLGFCDLSPFVGGGGVKQIYKIFRLDMFAHSGKFRGWL